MRIKIRQAIFGEKDNAHQLLVHSGESGSIFNEIKRFTDLPTHFPQGYNWSSYYSGLSFRDQFLFLRTFPDDRPRTRAGMVYTHALLAEIADIVQISDLTPVLDLLQSEPTYDLVPDEHEIDLDPDRMPGISRPFRFLQAAEQMVSGGRFPVIWNGPEDFRELVVTFWANMPLSLRRDFSFGMTISPNDLPERDLKLVHLAIPGSQKWAGYSIAAESGERDADQAGALLSGIPAGEQLRAFLKNETLDISSFDRLGLAGKCHELYQLSKSRKLSLDEAASLFRLVGTLCPEEEAGKNLKTRAAESLVTSIADCQVSELRRIRNLSLEGFADFALNVVSATSARLGAELRKPAEPSELLKLMEILTRDGSGPVFEGLKEQFSIESNYSSLAPIVWNAINFDPGSIVSIAKLVPDAAGIEEAFICSRPKRLDAAGAARAAEMCRERGWILLDYLVSVSAGSDAEPLKRLVEAGNGKLPKKLANRLVKETSADDVVRAIAGARIPDVEVRAAEIVLRHPRSAGLLDINSAYAQAILEEALRTDEDLLNSPEFPVASVASLIGLIAEKRPVRESLVNAVSGTSAADLSSHPHREKILANVDAETRKRFVLSTANAISQAVASGKEFPAATPVSVQEVLVSEASRSFILKSAGKRSPSVLLRLYHRFKDLSEDDFEKDLILVQTMCRKIDFVDSRGIGVLISERDWTRSANRIANDVLAYKRKDLIPGVELCYRLVDTWNQIVGWFRGSFPAVELEEREWWAILADEVSEVYREGPEDNEIWSRAGGSSRSMEYNGTTFQRWHRILNDLRNGGGGKKITIDKLLSTMMDDYPKNEKFRALIELLKTARWKR